MFTRPQPCDDPVEKSSIANHNPSRNEAQNPTTALPFGPKSLVLDGQASQCSFVWVCRPSLPDQHPATDMVRTRWPSKKLTPRARKQPGRWHRSNSAPNQEEDEGGLRQKPLHGHRKDQATLLRRQRQRSSTGPGIWWQQIDLSLSRMSGMRLRYAVRAALKNEPNPSSILLSRSSGQIVATHGRVTAQTNKTQTIGHMNLLVSLLQS